MAKKSLFSIRIEKEKLLPKPRLKAKAPKIIKDKTKYTRKQKYAKNKLY